MRVAVVGGGAWGSALAHLLSERHEVLVYDRSREKVELINSGLYPADPSLRLSPKVRATARLEELFDFGEVFLVAVAAQAVREVLARFPADFSAPLINTSKGIEVETLKTLSEVVAEVLPRADYFVLSGPSFAREVVLGKPTAVVLSGKNSSLGRRLQEEFNFPRFRVYWNDDTKGVELGGALKNVVAIAVGICDGLELGLNARSALITRGLKEMAFVGELFGARRETFYGLSGLGDLVLTATGDLSRNRRFGLAVGRGVPVEKALREVGTVEGYYTVKALRRFAEEKGVELPITETVYRVLYEGLKPTEAVEVLTNREPKEE
ncbi:MAG: NAD(P)-dependent glycerol-3-phosphate dehydrogenase [Aquificae bacterium]|nr:NAD(P)-dependent glycerol-3-phosphate dehydrogenase [Aquificota bacterium]